MYLTLMVHQNVMTIEEIALDVSQVSWYNYLQVMLVESEFKVLLLDR